MRVLFYSIVSICLFAVSCTSEISSDQGKLKVVSDEVPPGESGKLTFKSKDGLMITADYYPNENAKVIILLCHQAKYSRGEYKTIAPKLVEAGYACLAIDQRSGNMANEVLNETAQRAMQQGVENSKYVSAKPDIEAAIDFLAENTDKTIYLWGSSYSASLALMIGALDDRVKKIVAFSPGEFLGGQNTVKDALANLSKPVFLTGSQSEYDLIVAPIVQALPERYITAYKQTGQSDHGSKTLLLGVESSATTFNKVIDFLN